MKKYLPEISMVLVAFMYSCLSIGTKFMNVAMTPTIAFATRSFFGFVVGYFIFGIIYKNINLKKYFELSGTEWIRYFLMGAFGYAGSVILLSFGVLKTNLFTVAIIYSTIPIFVLLFEFLFFKQKVKPIYLLFLILSIFGVGLCSLTVENNLDFSLGAIFILIATILSAGYIIGISKFSGKLNSRELGFILMFIASASGFIFSLLTGYNIDWTNIFGFTFLLGLAIGACFNICASVIEPWAMQNMKNVSLGSQILLLEVVFSLVLGYILFSEIPSTYSIFGALLILISIAANNYIEN